MFASTEAVRDLEDAEGDSRSLPNPSKGETNDSKGLKRVACGTLLKVQKPICAGSRSHHIVLHQDWLKSMTSEGDDQIMLTLIEKTWIKSTTIALRCSKGCDSCYSSPVHNECRHRHMEKKMPHLQPLGFGTPLGAPLWR